MGGCQSPGPLLHPFGLGLLPLPQPSLACLTLTVPLGVYPVIPRSVFEETVPTLQLEVHMESYAA